LLIVNPNAGRSQIKGRLTDVLDTFTKAGFWTEVYITQKPGETTSVAKTRGPKLDRIVCCGGDGTLDEAINGLMQILPASRPELGYIPAGTTNDFAHSMNLPVDVLAAAKKAAEGKPFAYLVNGDLKGEENLRTVLKARADVGHSFLAGFANDADTIRDVSLRLAWALEQGYTPPRSFYGVGGMKIFRDLVWLMRGMMREDHLYYKAHGLYDFPQRRWPRMLGMQVLGALLRSRRIRRLIGDRMNEGMLAPYKKILNEGIKPQ
jgi:hypothetical protein